MKIKKGDKVLVLTGKNGYKKTQENEKVVSQGEVLQCFPKENRVLVQGINMVTRHTKPRKAGQPGGRIQKEAPIDASNVMVICAKCNKATRVGYKVESVDGKAVKTRICKKCGAGLDK